VVQNVMKHGSGLEVRPLPPAHETDFLCTSQSRQPCTAYKSLRDSPSQSILFHLRGIQVLHELKEKSNRHAFLVKLPVLHPCALALSTARAADTALDLHGSARHTTCDCKLVRMPCFH
jgi:hypothetical protein